MHYQVHGAAVSRITLAIATNIAFFSISSLSALAGNPAAFNSIVINVPNKDPQQAGLTTDFIVMAGENQTALGAAMRACQQLIGLEQVKAYDTAGYLPLCVREAEAAVLHSHSLAYAVGAKVFHQIDAYRAAVAAYMSPAEYALSWTYDIAKLTATLQLIDSHPEWRDVCLLGQYDAIAATAILAKRDNLSVIAFSHGIMSEFVPNLNEYPGRGVTAHDYSNEQRRQQRLNVSEQFLDEVFPHRYLSLNTDKASDIQAFFVSLEEANLPNTCDLIILDGRVTQHHAMHGVAAMEFHHHPDSHALLWFVPDEMLRSTTNIEQIESLQVIERMAVRAVFGSAAGQRNDNLQGKLVLAQFLSDLERISGVEYPRGMVRSIADKTSEQQ